MTTNFEKNPPPLRHHGAPRVDIVGVSKAFAAVPAVVDLDLHLVAGSLTALLGPSGCGKSTTLAMIGGLTSPDCGEIFVDSYPVTRMPAEDRPTGLVFQKPLLFPHLTMEQNVAFGLRMRGLPRTLIRHRVGEMMERVQLAGLGKRRVGELSGGQEQRVALARALVLQPPVLLLDEPFSALDSALRSQMRLLLRDLHAESEMTTLFVTHDQAEAVEVADSIALMLGGALQGIGAPQQFYLNPPSLAAARFFNVTNELPGAVAGGCSSSRGAVGDLPSPWPTAPLLPSSDLNVSCCARASSAIVAPRIQRAGPALSVPSDLLEATLQWKSRWSMGLLCRCTPPSARQGLRARPSASLPPTMLRSPWWGDERA
ncbi:ABC transporter ATP-binding protein [Nakamurella antarctica]|uniref:ABC-type quaternary amine transporter n=1 Tax=Nakamurella antarctica TaxID=1902245 RepID=A0A3G8ZMJ1_9ACTN|nr:ABC transporter ATP-binding protein [Nakamurella antarctica]AZI58368.1 ABC transporter ATP-binding protein [Nakamurella antarctica]